MRRIVVTMTPILSYVVAFDYTIRYRCAMTNDRRCGFDGCERKHSCKGLCSAHYWQRQRGQLLRPIGTRAKTPVQRFWENVDTSAGPDACWLWTGGLNPWGYGRLFADGTRHIAHRFSYEMTCGSIPDGMLVDHLCWTPRCVNPAHLRLADRIGNAENRRGAQKRNKTGARGVHYSVARKKYFATVTSRGITHRAGQFDTLEEADRAARELRLSLMTFNHADRRTA